MIPIVIRAPVVYFSIAFRNCSYSVIFFSSFYIIRGYHYHAGEEIVFPKSIPESVGHPIRSNLIEMWDSQSTGCILTNLAMIGHPNIFVTTDS